MTARFPPKRLFLPLKVLVLRRYIRDNHTAKADITKLPYEAIGRKACRPELN
jgi:hypothetical protein